MPESLAHSRMSLSSRMLPQPRVNCCCWRTANLFVSRLSERERERERVACNLWECTPCDIYRCDRTFSELSWAELRLKCVTRQLLFLLPQTSLLPFSIFLPNVKVKFRTESSRKHRGMTHWAVRVLTCPTTAEEESSRTNSSIVEFYTLGRAMAIWLCCCWWRCRWSLVDSGVYTLVRSSEEFRLREEERKGMQVGHRALSGSSSRKIGDEPFYYAVSCTAAAHWASRHHRRTNHQATKLWAHTLWHGL